MSFFPDTCPADRALHYGIPDARANAESPILEWLLHDDQVMRECFRHATAILKGATGALIAAVLLLDAEHQHYRAEVGLSVLPIPRKLSLCNYAVQTDNLFVVEDALVDARFTHCTLVRSSPFVRFYAAIPLRGPDGEIVGALCAMDPAPARLIGAQAEIFRHLRAMIENDLKLRTATATDPVTQLFNRRFMLESIRRRWDEAEDGEEMGAVMVDIDWFKQYNDTYGHQAGDACLRTVASVLQSIADEHQMIAGRLGGEEFGLLLCGLSRPALEVALEGLCTRVMRLAIAHRRSPAGVVTVSVGAAVTRRLGSSEAARQITFAAADRALYTAKDNGRNRVVHIDEGVAKRKRASGEHVQQIGIGGGRVSASVGRLLQRVDHVPPRQARTGLSSERPGGETQVWAHARNACPRGDVSDRPTRMTATRATGGSYALVFPVPKCAAVPLAAVLRIVAFLFWLAIPQSDGLQRPALRAFAGESADAPSRSRARVTPHPGADIG